MILMTAFLLNRGHFILEISNKTMCSIVILTKGVETMLTFHLTSVAIGTDRPCVEQLIERVGRGDREALAALYEETHAALYA